MEICRNSIINIALIQIGDGDGALKVNYDKSEGLIFKSWEILSYFAMVRNVSVFSYHTVCDVAVFSNAKFALKLSL